MGVGRGSAALVAGALLAGVLGGAAGDHLLGEGASRAGAQTELTVTPEQLRINQRISQAAVRRVKALEDERARVSGSIGAGTFLAPPAPGCDVQTFSGRGLTHIGTIARSCESVIEWTHIHEVPSFAIEDRALDGMLRIWSVAPSGSSILPPGRYDSVHLERGLGDWTITIRPR